MQPYLFGPFSPSYNPIPSQSTFSQLKLPSCNLKATSQTIFLATRVSPFRLKKFSLISETKQIWIRFTCVSLFHYKISLLFFASNFSLRFTLVIFASKRNKVKRNSSLFFRFFCFLKVFFRFYFAFFTFFAFFRFKFFALNFSLCFDLVIFASKQNKAKQNSSLFFRFFSLFSLSSLNFRFTSIFSLNVCFFYLRFRFRFLVFHIKVNHVKSGFFFTSKRNEIFTSISNFASEAKVRAHPTCNLSSISSQSPFLLTTLASSQPIFSQSQLLSPLQSPFLLYN
jgi:hypothetical protein